ncbi:hypothetical protein [Stakelama pacifica]|uniref:Uncharacterized protein n=1 Tax=Stakelama pacifica TaxID=517720 RepID=A0A4R6FWU3_9SPHN|nr:hypothetical protein [Stakelama pacifica]MAX00282.1 hypothetical protein [Sphingomonas sp.]TDN85455.1 hypothetical protein EV664_102161 [Stakelama pacifica]GGO92598.1 hypothetical protein GCM10011329_10060 [Stakelama pacifica]
MDLGSLWGVMTILGPILLAAVIIWAILHNRTSREQDAHTEAATQRMYDEQERDDKANENR